MTALVPHCPTLHSDRLTLRSPRDADFDHVGAFLTDPDRARGFGGPIDLNNAWRWYASMIGHWAIRGYGFWIADDQSQTPIGMAGLWNPLGWPEPELGWVLFAGHEGKGYATEAALTVRTYAYDTLGMPALTSNIVPHNDASKAVARRLGARLERVYENPNMGTDELWRHPGPDAAAPKSDPRHTTGAIQ